MAILMRVVWAEGGQEFGPVRHFLWNRSGAPHWSKSPREAAVLSRFAAEAEVERLRAQGLTAGTLTCRPAT